MEVTVREWVAGDEKETLTVMRQGASTNFWSACRVTWSKNLFIICVFILNAILYQISANLPTLVVCTVVMILSVILLNYIALLYYTYGPPLKDLYSIKTTYMSGKRTCFWVAEITNDESVTMGGDQHRKTIVGCIAVAQKIVQNNPVGWIRRMAVDSRYRRLGIATQLLQNAITFCRHHRYARIELITTESQTAAKKFYEQNGFTLDSYEPLSYLFGFIRIWTYHFYMDL